MIKAARAQTQNDHKSHSPSQPLNIVNSKSSTNGLSHPVGTIEQFTNQLDEQNNEQQHQENRYPTQMSFENDIKFHTKNKTIICNESNCNYVRQSCYQTEEVSQEQQQQQNQNQFQQQQQQLNQNHLAYQQQPINYQLLGEQPVAYRENERAAVNQMDSRIYNQKILHQNDVTLNANGDEYMNDETTDMLINYSNNQQSAAQPYSSHCSNAVYKSLSNDIHNPLQSQQQQHIHPQHFQN